VVWFRFLFCRKEPAHIVLSQCMGCVDGMSRDWSTSLLRAIHRIGGDFNQRNKMRANLLPVRPVGMSKDYFSDFDRSIFGYCSHIGATTPLAFWLSSHSSHALLRLSNYARCSALRPLFLAIDFVSGFQFFPYDRNHCDDNHTRRASPVYSPQEQTFAAGAIKGSAWSCRVGRGFLDSALGRSPKFGPSVWAI